MKEVLAEAGLTCFIKTSGNRGLHVYAPIEPTREFLDVRHGVIAAAREVERRMPKEVTTAWWKEERGKRIFLDFNQANRDRTIAGAYSPRALPHAPVSCPITWDELETADPKDFTILTVPDRLKTVGDPWADMQSNPGTIDTLLEWWDRDLKAGLGELAFPPDYPKMPGSRPGCSPAAPGSRTSGLFEAGRVPGSAPCHFGNTTGEIHHGGGLCPAVTGVDHRIHLVVQPLLDLPALGQRVLLVRQQQCA
jgi:hypothetical protein